MERIVVLGATSAIAQAFQRLCASKGKHLLLVGRSAQRLQAVSADLLARGARSAPVVTADLSDTSSHAGVLRSAVSALPDFDTVLLAYGSLHDQQQCRERPELVVEELNTNLVSAASILSVFANHFEATGGGCLAAISSVAGDRVRRSNYVYGASKAGLTLFLEGLRSRLRPSGVRVITIKPGMVDTPMTAHMSKSGLFAQPGTVASAIYNALERRSPEVVYTPGYWRYAMALIRALPRPILDRMPF